MLEEDRIYQKLRKEIDTRMPVGLPSSESGAEIAILKELFNPFEASITLHLSVLPEKLQIIYKRLKKKGFTLSEQDVEKILDNLVARGCIMGGKLIESKDHKKRYSLAMFTVGMFEFQLNQMSKKMAINSARYMREIFHKEFLKKGTPNQVRTLPIEKSITIEHQVSTYDNIRKIIEKKVGTISILNCVCRQAYELIGDPCKISDLRRICIYFGNKEEDPHPSSNSEEISKEDLFKLLIKYEKLGFVLQTENSQDPKFLCACCGCCCGVLTSAKRFPKPAEFYSSNYYARTNPDICNGCDQAKIPTCVRRCQMEAIKIENNKSIVDLDRCIGCGNCVPFCPQKAIVLVKKDKTLSPPKNTMSLYAKILMKKKGLIGSLSLAGKALFRRKI